MKTKSSSSLTESHTRGRRDTNSLILVCPGILPRGTTLGQSRRKCLAYERLAHIGAIHLHCPPNQTINTRRVEQRSQSVRSTSPKFRVPA